MIYQNPYAGIKITEGIDPSLCCPNCLEATVNTLGGSYRCEVCCLNWITTPHGVIYLTPIDGPYNALPCFAALAHELSNKWGAE